MARAKMTIRQLRQLRARTSWTRFHLPRGQKWPTWWNAYSDTQLGPLSGVAGCLKVWLGRKVEDPEQAALIIHWESAESLKEFQASPACAQFLRGLPENDVQASITSGALLQGLSLDDAGEASLSSVQSRFLTFKWTYGCVFENNLKARITTTALEIPYTGDPTPESWAKTVDGTFRNFSPKCYEDFRVYWPRPRTYTWTAWAWVDSDLYQLGNRAVFCEFRRWIEDTGDAAFNGATPEREEVVSKSPETRESWAQAVAEVMPPVAAWEQERWDIQVATCFIPPEEDEEE